MIFTRPKATARTHSTRLSRLAAYLILGCACIILLAPLVWALVTSVKPADEVIQYPPKWIPLNPTLKNYLNLFGKTNMPKYLLNSLVIALGTSAITVLLGSHAGYAAARYAFPGRSVLLLLVLACIMIPGISILVPIYLLENKLGLYNTYPGLIIVFSAWQIPTSVWLLKGFFESIPRDMEESGLIDGCTRLGTFYRISLPLATPGLAASGILAFIYAWNNFLISFTLTGTENMRPLTVGLYMFITEIGIEWQNLMAGALIALMPALCFFLLLQKRFIQGLTSGALKG